jgi:hypothetical protein
MKKTIISAILLFVTLAGFAQKGQKILIGEQAIFKVKRTFKPITIDGQLSEMDWNKTESRTLSYYYRTDNPEDKQKTTFRMLWDDKNLYVFFQFEDKYITALETERDGEPYLDDCGEIFLIPVPDSLNMHIGFELNPYKASNDFVYFNDFYKGKNVVMKSYNPHSEVEVSINGTINNNADIDSVWNLEMAIPLTEFAYIDRFSPVKEGNKWAFQAIRQERNGEEGERKSTSTLFPIYDIKKGVHQPNHFGLMEFVK